MDRIQLPNGCYCSRPRIHPKNHESRNADLSKDWYIHYRFYDPSIKEGKYANTGKPVIKKGMNGFNDHSSRLEAAKELLEDEIELLQKQGYNPITGLCKPDAKTIADLITPDTSFPEALDQAVFRLSCTPKYIRQIKIGLVHIHKAITTLRLHKIRVQDIKIRDVSLVLEQVGIDKRGWSNCNYNHHRTYLMVLFKKIVPLANMAGNPVKDIEKKAETKKIPILLTTEQRLRIHKEIHKINYRFWRYIHIFFSSHGRSTELFRLNDRDVDLENNRFKVLILKGDHYFEDWKPIKPNVKHLWEEIMNEVSLCRQKGIEDGVMTVDTPILLFSTRLKPGIVSVNPETISKKWRTSVKKKMGIPSDFYKLKHLNNTELSRSLGAAQVAAYNSHKTDKLVKAVYDVEFKDRELKKLTESVNDFA